MRRRRSPRSWTRIARLRDNNIDLTSPADDSRQAVVLVRSLTALAAASEVWQQPIRRCSAHGGLAVVADGLEYRLEDPADSSTGVTPETLEEIFGPPHSPPRFRRESKRGAYQESLQEIRRLCDSGDVKRARSLVLAALKS